MSGLPKPAENPFKLEKDNKKFFIDMIKNSSEASAAALDPTLSASLSNKNNRSLPAEPTESRIKNLNKEIEQLAKHREQLLFKDSQLDYVFKNQRPAIRLNDFLDDGKDKKFRVRTILKCTGCGYAEKRQTLHEFLQKKKEIFLSKMNINIKKEQTNKLEDYIKDQQSTLRARQLYFKNDRDFMQKFIDDIKSQAQEAQNIAEAELKTQEQLTAELTSLQTEIERKDNLITKANDDFESLQAYKQFLDKFLNFSNATWRPYRKEQPKKDVMFLTEGNHKVPEPEPETGITIPFCPENLLDIFNQIEENNLGEIQNRHDTEAQLQKVRASEKEITEIITKTEADFEQRIRLLQKSEEIALKKNLKLKEMKKNHKNKIRVTDNEDLDLEKIGGRILELYKDINPKFKPQDGKGPDSKELKKCMTEIEQEIIRLREQIAVEKQTNPARDEYIEQQLKKAYKKENIERKKNESKEAQERRQSEQTKKKNQASLALPKGRRDMAKVLLEKKVRRQVQTVVDNSNNEDKYFKADDDSESQS